MARSRKNVLVARFSALGDIAMAIPVVYNACAANPDMQFYFLTRKHPATLFINPPENLTVVPVNTDDYKGVGGMFRLAGELRGKFGVDLFLDLHDVLRTRILGLALWLRGVKVKRIRKGRGEKRALTRHKNKVLVQLTPTLQRYRSVFDRAMIPNTEDFKSLFGDGKGSAKAFASVTDPKKDGEKWLAVAPFARHAGKIYPLDLMSKVIDHYADKPEWKIFILGFGPKETEQIDMLAGSRKNVVNMARAALGIGAELSLLSHCDVMLSMDSANMHMASLVGLRAVTVWGATHPYTGFMGWNQDLGDVAQIDMTCRPCSVFGNKPCKRGDYHCLKGIPPSLIVSKIGE